MTDSEKVNNSLLEVGFEVDSVYDLVNTTMSYPEAIQPLIEHLKNIQDVNIKEGIIRALTVKEAKGIANNPLFEEYNKTNEIANSGIRWVIGNAFTVIIGAEDVDRILKIVSNKDNGMSRQMFVMALSKIKSRKQDIENVLIDLLDDDLVCSHAINTLGKLKSVKAKPLLLTLTEHSRPLVRKEVVKALKKIEKETK
ncbi:HEAT repeat domain-containing protein [Dysgonomonas sp. UBA7698]|uniref:HEAT repeat domain-containing protein n=1 Tax=Dysgonomonas sp. UBA7698 TaxID=1946427 RepID=UPI0025BC5A9B|nr:HEAT repeat domain-containing protein [Dysgonomonas sp. UBA7698]